MTTAIAGAEPTQFVGGDTVAWTRVVSSYPPRDGWTLKYRFIAGGVDVTISDDANGGINSEYSLAIPASKTAEVRCEIDAKLIGWVERTVDTVLEAHAIFDGTVRVLANARTATAEELLSHEERVLAAIQCRIEGRAAADVARYGREGVFVDKLAMSDLLRVQGIYKAKLWRRQNPGAMAPVNVIRFSSPGGGNAAERLAWPGADS